MRMILIGPAWRAPVISLVMLLPAPLLAQQRPVIGPIESGTSSISGRVTDSMSKAPIAGCTIRATAGPGFQRATLTTDADGSYALPDIAAGRYVFWLECPGYLRSCSQRDAAENSGAPCGNIDVVRDQRREGVDFRMIPGAIARGQVMTFDGRPVTRAGVRLGRGLGGEPTFMVSPATTDTEGRFELKDLPAGEWRLEVEIPPDPGGLRPPIVYYPGGLSWEEAVGVVLVAGKVTDDLTVVVPRIYENILTVVVPPPDATISDLAVSVLRESPLAVRRIDLNADGVGTVKGILPGRYFVAARAASRDKQWAGFEVVDFVEDSYEARLQLQPTGAISGRIVAETGAPPPLDGVIVGASWIYDGAEVNPLAADEAKVAPDGSFRIDHLFGTRRLQLRALDLGWELAAVRQNRTDVSTSGIGVVPDDTVEATIVLRRRR
jgi:hypothetical protein